MAYRIDFTASNYAGRARRKAFLRFLLLAAIGGVAYGVYDVYTTYNQPTLNMRLSEYEAVAFPIENINAAWDDVAKKDAAMTRYYRLLWATNPTNFLNAMVSTNAPHLRRGFNPVRWVMKTGGECRLDYRYVFQPGDKAEQARGIEAEVVNVVTSVVKDAVGKVDVQGVQTENLLNVEELKIVVKFPLADVMAFPAKVPAIGECVKEITDFRNKVQDAKVTKDGNVKGAPSPVKTVMMDYLPKNFEKDKEGKVRPDFPDIANVINVSGWFDRADQFINSNKIPGNADERRRAKEAWNKVGDARFPWDRHRELDNELLVSHTKSLQKVSDGVKSFKGFLDERKANYVQKLEPFIDAYDRNDVFNKPYIETDLRDRVAKSAGVFGVRIDFSDDKGSEPAFLSKDDNNFTFTWVRWKFAVDGGMNRKGERTQQDEEAGAANEPLTLMKLADCVRKALELGPGYALDSAMIDFKDDGSISGMVMEGLLPVKKVEQRKETAKNVN